jgi:hypothetical protein
MAFWSGLTAQPQLVASASMFDVITPPSRVAHTITAEDVSGLVGDWMTSRTAMQVPAFARGLRLVTGLAGGFPLVSYGQTSPRLLQSGRMSTHVSDAALLSSTVSDLICHGRAGWKFDATRSFVRRLRPDVLEPQTSDWFAEPDEWLVDGRRDRDIVVFDSGTAGVLRDGWATIRTAINLERAAAHIAETPLPSTTLQSRGPELEDSQIQDLLTQYERFRRHRSTAYLSSTVELHESGWSSAELQLVEARQHTAVEVARLLNLDPYWVGAGVSGSSLTYQNRQDMNQSLLDLTVLPLLRVIEQGLSTFLSEGHLRHVLRFDTSVFTRESLASRVAALTQYTGAGILTPAEARDLEPLIHEGDVPA